MGSQSDIENIIQEGTGISTNVLYLTASSIPPLLTANGILTEKAGVFESGTIPKDGVKSKENASRATRGKIKFKKRKKSGNSVPVQHKCDTCSRTFNSPCKLIQHKYSHSGETPFPCQHCNKAFSSRFKLVRHQLTHMTERQHKCSFCERCFHRKDHLKNHFKVHNPEKNVYRCEKEGCRKEYNSQLSYRKHIANHAAEEGDLECKVCRKMFLNKDELIFHLKVHSGSRAAKSPSEKKFKCDFCDQHFFTRKDVKRHSVVHTKVRDFLCQFCPQRFGRKDHLVRHIKKSHSAESTATSEVKSPQPPSGKTSSPEPLGTLPSQSLQLEQDLKSNDVNIKIEEEVLLSKGAVTEYFQSKCPQKFGRKDHFTRNIKKNPSPESMATSEIKSPQSPSGKTVSPEPLGTLPSPSLQLEQDLKSNDVNIKIEEEMLLPMDALTEYFLSNSTTSQTDIFFANSPESDYSLATSDDMRSTCDPLLSSVFRDTIDPSLLSLLEMSTKTCSPPINVPFTINMTPLPRFSQAFQQ